MHLQLCVNERWLLQDFKKIPSTFVHNLCIFIQKLCVITNWQGEMTSFILFRTIYSCTSVHKLILQYEMSQLLLWYKYQHYIWVKYLIVIELNWMIECFLLLFQEALSPLDDVARLGDLYDAIREALDALLHRKVSTNTCITSYLRVKDLCMF